MARYTDRYSWVAGSTRKHSPDTISKKFRAIYPATLEHVSTIHASTPRDVDAAVGAAQAAFPAWSSMPTAERASILQKAAEVLLSKAEDLATLETYSTGKPYSETSAVDIVTGVATLTYYANLIASGGLNGESFSLRKHALITTTKMPLGVCAGIGAWNYPMQIALWKSAPCLAAGNCMVYKPSEFTSLHAEELAKCYKEAGVPDGVFNVVYGDGEVGGYLTEHPGIAKVSFTGQISTGKRVAGSAARGMKYVTMELGGKSPLIILDDCDIDVAVDGAMLANFFSSGQVCTNGTRVFVPRKMKQKFERRLLDKLPYVRPGDLFDEKVNFGPLVSNAHFKKVTEYIKHGIESDKATLLCGGYGRPDDLPPLVRDGLWVKPTIFTDCTDDMKIVREEIFGPVMCLLYYDTDADAIRRANNTDTGLAAGVFGKDLVRCHEVIHQLEAGITWINTWGESPAEMAVGGWKQSGLGVENGRQGLEAWTKNKSTLMELSGSVPTVFAKL